MIFTEIKFLKVTIRNINKFLLGQIPILHSVANDALCDIRRQDCGLAQVIGDGFIDNSRLTCIMTEAKVCNLARSTTILVFNFISFLI